MSYVRCMALAALTLSGGVLVSGMAQAQAAPGAGWSAGPATSWTGAPASPLQGYAAAPASDVEIGTLYGLSVGYGVGVGVWLDAELKIDDPGLVFLPPAILGVAAPVGVFLLDRPRMPRGMPAAIAAGMAIGAGEGIGLASYQYVHSDGSDAWGFRGFARSVFIGSTAGTAVGYLTAVAMEPSPKTSLLMGSSVLWGTAIGSMFGYGGSRAGSEFGDANDSASLAGFIGYNAGLLGSAALSTVWVPSYQSLEWMWLGFGAGLGVSLPVYLFYAGGDHDVRRGLIVQGTAATLGLAAGAIFTMDSSDSASAPRDGLFGGTPGPGQRVTITGGGLMPVVGGFGVQLSGLLF